MSLDYIHFMHWMGSNDGLDLMWSAGIPEFRINVASSGDDHIVNLGTIVRLGEFASGHNGRLGKFTNGPIGLNIKIANEDDHIVRLGKITCWARSHRQPGLGCQRPQRATGQIHQWAKRPPGKSRK